MGYEETPPTQAEEDARVEELEDEKGWEWVEPDPVLWLPAGTTVETVENGEKVTTYTRKAVLRAMDGWCEDKLLDTTGDRHEKAARINEVLSRCLVSLGPKTRPDDGERHHRFFEGAINRMPLVNKFAMIVRIRQLSVHDEEQRVSGHKYVFDATCPLCKKLSKNYVVRLDTMRCVFIPDDICQSDVHTLTTKGHSVVWRLLRGEDETALGKIQEDGQSDLLSAVMKMSLVTLDGKPVKSLAVLKDLPKAARGAIQRTVQPGGLDPTVVNTCPKCKGEFSMQLPWGQKGFFFPSED